MIFLFLFLIAFHKPQQSDEYTLEIVNFVAKFRTFETSGSLKAKFMINRAAANEQKKRKKKLPVTYSQKKKPHYSLLKVRSN